MFYCFDDVVRFCRVFRGLPVDVSEELRGWRWFDYPVVCSSSVRLGVSDIAGGFCDSGRFVYLKYVLRVKQPRVAERVALGSFIHRVYSEIVRVAKKSIYMCNNLDKCSFKENFESHREDVFRGIYGEFKGLKKDIALKVFNKLWDYGLNVYCSAFEKVKSMSPYLRVDGAASLIVPLATEFPIDGSLIGLTKAIRVDGFLPPSIIVELKTRELKPVYNVALAAYAMAFESQYEVPVNYGVLVNLRFGRNYSSFKVYEKIVKINDSLRQEFIDLRDKMARIVEEELDPGFPEKCDPECPYLTYCREERG